MLRFLVQFLIQFSIPLLDSVRDSALVFIVNICSSVSILLYVCLVDILLIPCHCSAWDRLKKCLEAGAEKGFWSLTSAGGSTYRLTITEFDPTAGTNHPRFPNRS